MTRPSLGFWRDFSSSHHDERPASRIISASDRAANCKRHALLRDLEAPGITHRLQPSAYSLLLLGAVVTEALASSLWPSRLARRLHPLGTRNFMPFLIVPNATGCFLGVWLKLSSFLLSVVRRRVLYIVTSVTFGIIPLTDYRTFSPTT